MQGTIFSGKGKGKYFMSQLEYKRQFEKILGFIPFEGTLNVRVNVNDTKNFLKNKESMIISGFISGKNNFGGLKCYKIKINTINGALIIPDRTQYDEKTVELIAEVNIRKSLGLKDGDIITISNN
jgi:riboflavin kinase